MKSKRLQLLLLAALSCAVLSCSEGKSSPQGKEEPATTSKLLTREQAAEAIIQHYDYPNVEVERVVGAPYVFAHLQPAGGGPSIYGGIQIGVSSDVFFYEREYDGTNVLTEKGLQFVAPAAACDACIEPMPNIQWKNRHFYCVATNIWEFQKVTGISQNEVDKSATVEYTSVAKSVNTFGQYTGKKEGMEVTHKITMKQYDDGSWRIEDGKPTYVVKPDEIPFYANAASKR